MVYADSYAIDLADVSVLTGTWTGTYKCAQGFTGLLLKTQGNQDGSVQGEFDFYPIEGYPYVATGSFLMEGHYSMTHSLTLKGIHWIDRPFGYSMVDLRGLMNPDMGTFRGVVSALGCGEFDLHR